MPGRHHGSNKNQNQHNIPRNQGNSTPGGQNKGATPGQTRSGSSTPPGGQARSGSSTPQGGQPRANSSTPPGAQHRAGSSMQPMGGSLDSRTKEELYAQAKKEGIEGRSHVTKAELIRALKH